VGSKQDAPAAPDYQALASQTAASNRDAARYQTQANRIDQSTPYGSINYTNNRTLDWDSWNNAVQRYNAEMENWQAHGSVPGQAPAAPNQSDFMQDNWSSDIKLSPAQELFLAQRNYADRSLGMAGGILADQIQANAGKGIDVSDLPGMIYGIGDGSTGDTWSKYSDLLMQRMNPDLDKQQAALDTKLANMGLTAGSEGWRTQQDQFGKQRNDAALDAQIQGANLALQGAQLNNQTRQQAVTERNLLQQIPINQLNAIRSGSQITNPTFYTPGMQSGSGGTDYTSAGQQGYNSLLNSVNANNAQAAGNTQAGVGLASAAIMAAAMY